MQTSAFDRKKTKKKLLPANPAVRFLLFFGIGMVVFYAIYKSAFFDSYIGTPFVQLQAYLTAFLLNIFGASATAAGTVINGAEAGQSIDIKGGCDGLEATALLLCAVAVFPTNFKLKIPGLVFGFLALFVLNLLRLAVLYIAKGNASQAVFDLLHEQGGFIIFTALSIVIWMIWANWAMKKEKVVQTEQE